MHSAFMIFSGELDVDTMTNHLENIQYKIASWPEHKTVYVRG